MRKTILIFLLLTVPAAAAQAELYAWTDSAGRENYVDDLSKVPAKYRSHAIKVKPSSPQVSMQSGPAGRVGPEDPPQQGVDSGKRESAWRTKADDLRRRIKLKQEDLDYFYGLRKDCAEYQKTTRTYRNRDCKNLYSDNIKQMKSDIEKLKDTLENDLPEEARKAGADPGWLRESDTPVHGQAGSDGKDESWWRNQARTAREQLSKEQHDLDNLIQLEEECEETQRYNTGCRKKNCKVMYESRRKNAERKVTKLKHRLEVELPEEARRTGAYPGWLRE